MSWDEDYCDRSGGSFLGNLIGLALFAMILIGLFQIAMMLIKTVYTIFETLLLWVISVFLKRQVTPNELYGWYGIALLVVMWLAISTTLAFIAANAIYKGLGL